MERKLKYIQFDNGTELISWVDLNDWENTNSIKLYDPYRLYPIPPFLSPDDDTDHQTLILIKWLPWTDDNYINIMIDKILVVTDVSAHMQKYYESNIQRVTEELIEEEFRQIEDVPESSLTLSEDESEGIEGNSIEELAELLNKLAKKTKKRVLH